MTPLDWAKRPLKKYATFAGRAARPEYWWFTLATFIAFALATIMEGTVGLGGSIFAGYGPLSLAVCLGVTVPAVAAGVRRLHDTGKSGWWMLIALVPVAGLAIFYLLALPGDPHDNRFGLRAI